MIHARAYSFIDRENSGKNKIPKEGKIEFESNCIFDFDLFNKSVWSIPDLSRCFMVFASSNKDVEFDRFYFVEPATKFINERQEKIFKITLLNKVYQFEVILKYLTNLSLEQTTKNSIPSNLICLEFLIIHLIELENDSNEALSYFEYKSGEYIEVISEKIRKRFSDITQVDLILRNFTSQFDSDNYDLVYKIKSNSVNTLFENHHFIINHDFKNGKVRCNTYSKDLKFMGTDFLKFIDLEVNTDYKSIVEFNRKVEKKENSLIDEGGYTRQELDEMYKAAYENDGQWTWNND